jgi:multidrug efflux pump subunit AcrB
VLAWCLRHRPAFLALVVLVFVGSLALFPLVGVSFFPKAEKPQFMVDVHLPRGTNLEATDQAARYVERVLAQQPEVTRYLTNVGKGNPVVYYNMSYTEPKPYYAQVFVQVDESRGRNTGQLVADLRSLFGDFPAGELKVWEFMQGPNTDAPVVIRIFGENLETLSQLAGEVEQLVHAIPGTIYVDNPLQVSGTGLAVDLQRDKAQLLGLTPGTVDRTVRASLAGLSAARYRDANGKEYAIVLRLPLSGPPTPQDFERIRLTTAAGDQVPLAQIAEVRLQARQAVIHHYRLERVAVIYADAAGRSVDAVTQDVVRTLEGYRWPAGYRYAMGGELESREESFGSLGQAVLIALVCMFGILVLEFRSLGQPFVIFVAIPLAVIGSVLGLLFTGYSFSFTAFLGVTSLVGIVVNNSILLVDTANQKRLEGSPTEVAVLIAGVSRFIPVTLTSVTTIVGLLPLALTGDTMWAPMSWAIIGGLTTSTLLTLLVVPALYLIFTPRLHPASAGNVPAGEMPR